MRFENKVVVVTGAAQGIGEAYARALAAEGASVVVADLNTEAGEKVAGDIGGLFVRCDVSSHEDAAALVDATVDRCRIHVVDGEAARPGEQAPRHRQPDLAEPDEPQPDGRHRPRPAGSAISLVSRYSSKPATPISRPIPDCL